MTLLAILGCFSSRAGLISMEVSATGAVSNGLLEVSCQVHNRGDEDAEASRLTPLYPPGGTFSRIGSIPEGTLRKTKIAIPLPGDLPAGEHHALLRFSYRDRGGGSAGVPLAVPFRTGKERTDSETASPPVPRVFVRLAPLRLRRHAELVLTAAAVNAPSGIVATLRLVLPEEIGHDPGPHDWTIPAAGGSRHFALTNISASAGNRYSALAVVDFMSAEDHKSIAVEAPILTPPPLSESIPWRPLLLGAALAVLLLALVGARGRPAPRPHREPPSAPGWQGWIPPALTAGAVLLIVWQVMPPEILLDTTAVGGDSVAHHYLASQLRRQLLEQGRIVGWAPGWWGGFPLFQFYFPLPYLFILCLDSFLPYTLAFKFASILPLALTPLCLWLSGRIVRLPRPMPSYLALASIPLLLDTTHTMWGVNAYSTLAGMIANSYSFALLPLALACALRDARTGRFQLATPLLMSAVVLSHFFTSLFMVLICAGIPWLPEIPHRRRAFLVLLAEGLLSVLLCAWWLVPLIAKREWSIDFGVNWEVDIFHNLPIFLRRAALPIVGAYLAVRFLQSRTDPSREPRSAPAVRTFAGMLAVMLGFALGLFYAGFELSPVFVNVRFWPFIVFSAATLTAVCAARFSARLGLEPGGIVGFCLLILALGWDRPNHARAWARHNFRGLEPRTEASQVFSRLVKPLDGTPGRLAFDLHPDNERLGSSRIFESVPHLFDKPILEGGLVNSALGALPAYLIQSETSDNAAGFPPILKPREFDIEAATLHMNWMNVSHFIARSPRTKSALRTHPSWRELDKSGPWSLFQNLSHSGSLVKVPRKDFQTVFSPHPQEDILEWMYRPAAADTPFVLLPPNAKAPGAAAAVIQPGDYGKRLDRLQAGPLPDADRLFTTGAVHNTVASAHRIAFRTSALGRAHVVSASWFPNWQATGADGPYLVAPGLMLLIPYETQVELCYTDLPSDKAGRLLSLLGVILLVVYGCRRLYRGHVTLKTESREHQSVKVPGRRARKDSLSLAFPSTEKPLRPLHAPPGRSFPVYPPGRHGRHDHASAGPEVDPPGLSRT